MRATEPGYSGMTVNERLVASGLLSAWDSAIRNGERQVAIDLLSQVDLMGQAAEIVDTVFGDPAKDGSHPPIDLLAQRTPDADLPSTMRGR